jgi:hypothetical protein
VSYVPRVLVACESSGIVRDEFVAAGCEAVSCDLLESESCGPHIMGDARLYLDLKWDLVIAHPPCTYLCSSGIHWNKRRPERENLTKQALDFFLVFTKLKCCWAIENPIGIMSTHYRKPDQIIQPHQFGHDASKSTCLWLNGLPKLTATSKVNPRIVDGKPRWANQTDSGQNKLPPSEDRWRERSRTYVGIAKAMATQWTPVLMEKGCAK